MGVITTLWLVPLIALVIVCIVLLALRFKAVAIQTGSPERRYWRSVLVMGGVVTVIRVGISWWATYRAFIRQESLSELPLLALIMPEYLLAPGDPATPAGMWTLTAALVIGTFVMYSALALLVWRLFRRAGSEGVA